jgi:hypothetical protein
MTSQSEEFAPIASPCVAVRRWCQGMEQLGTVLEREGEALESLLFKLVETSLLLEADEARFLPRATREVERTRSRARELDLLRAATAARFHGGTTLRELAAGAPGPWPAILRDHHEVLSRLVDEIEVVAHRNAHLARVGLDALSRQAAVAAAPVPAGVGGGQPTTERSPAPVGRPVRNAELDRLARGAALDAVLGTATRLRMPDLIEFLR